VIDSLTAPIAVGGDRNRGAGSKRHEHRERDVEMTRLDAAMTRNPSRSASLAAHSGPVR
jgi:hypothetical protein